MGFDQTFMSGRDILDPFVESTYTATRCKNLGGAQPVSAHESEQFNMPCDIVTCADTFGQYFFPLRLFAKTS